MVDVIDRLMKAIHNADIEDVIIVFGVPVLLGCGLQAAGCRPEDFVRRVVGAELHLIFGEPAVDARKEIGGDGSIHEQGFHCIANRRALALGVGREAD